jgi:L-ribulokinase
LLPGTAIGVGNTDAHIAVPAVGVTEEGRLVLIMGTSVCHMVLSKKERAINGICGYVEDGIIPGFYGYEAGQSAVGDIFDWFASNFIPNDYYQEAVELNISLLQLMDRKAEKIVPGKSGLLALDWENGNRTLLVDTDLSGLVIGCDLHTKAEEVYRALIESTAFGTRIIVEEFQKNDIEINEVVACGGLSYKSPVVMQIFADVLGKEIKISESTQTSALGAAMFGAVAAGEKGHIDIFTAAKKMSRLRSESYKPNEKHYMVYTRIFEEYKKLYEYFGKTNNVMKILRQIKHEQMLF